MIALIMSLCLLFTGCTTMTMNTTPSEPLLTTSPGRAVESAPPSYVDIDENVYQNADDSEASLDPGDPNLKAETSAASLSTQTDATPKTEQAKLDEALEFCRDSQEYWQRGELEKAVEALDQAYLLILEVEPQDDFKLVQEYRGMSEGISPILAGYSSCA